MTPHIHLSVQNHRKPGRYHHTTASPTAHFTTFRMGAL